MLKATTLISALFLIQGLSAQVDYGVEFTLSGTNTSIFEVGSYLAEKHQNLSSGRGSDWAVGGILGLGTSTFRLGFRKWSWPFTHTYVSENKFTTETGNLKSSGIYFRYEPTWKYFYLTSGLDISMATVYKNDMVQRNENGVVIASEDDRQKSILPRNFGKQVNIIFGAGPTIAVGDSFRIKGIIAVAFPFTAAYDPGVNISMVYIHNGEPAPDAEPTINFTPAFQYGISVAYTFGKKASNNTQKL